MGRRVLRTGLAAATMTGVLVASSTDEASPPAPKHRPRMHTEPPLTAVPRMSWPFDAYVSADGVAVRAATNTHCLSQRRGPMAYCVDTVDDPESERHLRVRPGRAMHVHLWARGRRVVARLDGERLGTWRVGASGKVWRIDLPPTVAPGAPLVLRVDYRRWEGEIVEFKARLDPPLP
jgi:hypothetical protein